MTVGLLKVVKNYAKKIPIIWEHGHQTLKTHVATMNSGDFRHNEQSVTIKNQGSLKITLKTSNASKITLKDAVPVLPGEVVDGTFMSKTALLEFLAHQVKDARDQGVLFSLHMKATMMKVSDPIIFGHAVKVYFKELLTTMKIYSMNIWEWM